jgi:pilus assembly protein CpaD
MRKEGKMRSKLALLLIATALSGCSTTSPAVDQPDRGLMAVNVPVIARQDFVFDAAAPGGVLAPGEAQRLSAWLSGLGVAWGDTVYVDGYADSARSEVARVAGNYGLLVSTGAPVTAGAVAPGSVRVVVSRNRALVPNCPNWSTPSAPNYENRTMSNFGCAVNSNLAAMVANPQDLFHGREGSDEGTAEAAAKAINMYRNWPLTGIADGQGKRPLKQNDTRKDD